MSVKSQWATTSDLKLSGYAYVPMRMKYTDEPMRPTPTKIASERFCEHEVTVCVKCLDSWMLDWDVFFNRTAGGRRLKERFEAARRGKQKTRSS